MRLYEYSVGYTGLASVRGLIQIVAAAAKPIKIVEASVTNISNTTNQLFDIGWIRATAAGTYADTLAAVDLNPGDGSPTVTVTSGTESAAPTYDTKEVGHEAISSLVGWRYYGGLWVPAADVWVLKTHTAPTSFNARVRIVIGELF